jgi:uncharacterized membrane protein YjdF
VFLCLSESLSVLNQIVKMLGRIYFIKLEIMNTTYTAIHALFIDLHLEIDSWGWLRKKLYDKIDHFSLAIVNSLLICRNIPVASVYGVYISQLLYLSILS